MSTQTHTPGPWKTGEGEFVDQVFSAEAHGEDWGGWLICETGGSDANAEFIVRACNAHEELVKALELCVDALEFIPCRARNEAKQALALVK